MSRQIKLSNRFEREAFGSDISNLTPLHAEGI